MSAENDFQPPREPELDQYGVAVQPARTTGGALWASAFLVCAAAAGATWLTDITWEPRRTLVANGAPRMLALGAGFVGLLPLLPVILAVKRGWAFNFGKVSFIIAALSVLIGALAGGWLVLLGVSPHGLAKCASCGGGY